MADELELVQTMIEEATCPEEVFGDIKGDNKQGSLTHVYHSLVKAVYPSADKGDKRAGNAFTRLSLMRASASRRIGNNTYGSRLPITQSNSGEEPIVINGKYTLTSLLAHGDIAEVYVASRPDKEPVVVKIGRNTKDNDLMLTEYQTINAIRTGMAKATLKSPTNPWLDCIPRLVEQTFVGPNLALGRRVNVLEYFEDYMTVEELHRRLPNGIDGRTVVWMWKKLLLLLDWVHKMGFVHGAVLPTHVMFIPDTASSEAAMDTRTHVPRIVDWCYSVKNNRAEEYPKSYPIRAWCPKYQSLYPSEALRKRGVQSSTDLFMAAQTMIYLIANNPEVPTPILNNIKMCIHPNENTRPHDAQIHRELFISEVVKLYGKTSFHRFEVP